MDIITITGPALDALKRELGATDAADVHTLRVASDHGEVKMKINESVWSPGWPEAPEDTRRRVMQGRGQI